MLTLLLIPHKNTRTHTIGNCVPKRLLCCFNFLFYFMYPVAATAIASVVLRIKCHLLDHLHHFVVSQLMFIEIRIQRMYPRALVYHHD